jgi:hypothetical protein
MRSAAILGTGAHLVGRNAHDGLIESRVGIALP